MVMVLIIILRDVKAAVGKSILTFFLAKNIIPYGIMSSTKLTGKLERDKNKIKAHKISKQQIISQKSENQKTKSPTSSQGQNNLDGQLSNQLKISNIIKYGLIKKAKEDNLNQVKDILREKLIYNRKFQVF